MICYTRPCLVSKKRSKRKKKPDTGMHKQPPGNEETKRKKQSCIPAFYTDTRSSHHACHLVCMPQPGSCHKYFLPRVCHVSYSTPRHPPGLIASAVDNRQSLLSRFRFFRDALSLPRRWFGGIDRCRCTGRLGAIVAEMSFACSDFQSVLRSFPSKETGASAGMAYLHDTDHPC